MPGNADLLLSPPTAEWRSAGIDIHFSEMVDEWEDEPFRLVFHQDTTDQFTIEMNNVLSGRAGKSGWPRQSTADHTNRVRVF